MKNLTLVSALVLISLTAFGQESSIIKLLSSQKVYSDSFIHSEGKTVAIFNKDFLFKISNNEIKTIHLEDSFIIKYKSTTEIVCIGEEGEVSFNTTYMDKKKNVIAQKSVYHHDGEIRVNFYFFIGDSTYLFTSKKSYVDELND